VSKRYFTVAEANALIPQIESMLLSLQGIKRELDVKYRRLQQARLDSVPNDDAFFPEEAEIEFLLFSANSMLQQIFDLGVQVKDIDSGLCDFPTLINGQEALLCWHLGERDVRFWHGLYEGYQGRKPLF
jgi:hypothetical protein